MGQKVNPVGFRLGVNRGWDSVWYAKKKDFGNYLDPYHRTKLQDWSYEVGEVESLFFNIGVTDNNYFAYETFVNNLAPLDLAWVALQRMIESDIKNKDWTSAKVTLTEFEAKFQTKNGNKVTDLLNELEKAETSVTISSLKRVNTAYDEYALKAFEVNALDYLMKPVEESRLQESIDKIAKRIEKKKSEEKSGKQKGQKVANVRASILPDSGGSKQQKAKKKGPALKDERL